MNKISQLFFCLLLIPFNYSCKEPDEIVIPINNEPKNVFHDHNKLIVGADLSYTNAMIDNGGVYKLNGIQKDPYEIFKNKGCNLVRVRLWHTPSWQSSIYGNVRYSDLNDVIRTINKAKESKIAVLLDLHYSDEWADPAKQHTPQAWKNANLDVLKDSVYQYTMMVLNRLKEKNLTPEYIQIGNENNSGILHPIGKIGNNANSFISLVNMGIKAVRDFSQNSTTKPKVILHFAQLQNAEWWLKSITDAKVDNFDIIGLSHYSKWSDIKTMDGVTKSISTIKAKYNKDIIVVETAYPWSGQSNDGYSNIFSVSDSISRYRINKENQKKYMIDLTQAILNGGGKGVIYWEPSWISTPNFKDLWGKGSSWENNAFFDFTGEALPVMSYMTYDYKY